MSSVYSARATILAHRRFHSEHPVLPFVGHGVRPVTIGPDQEGPRPGPPRTSRRDSFVSLRERPSEVQGFGKWNARSSFVLVCFRLRCWAKVTCIHFRGPALHGSTSCGYLRYYVFRGAVLVCSCTQIVRCLEATELSAPPGPTANFVTATRRFNSGLIFSSRSLPSKHLSSL